MRKREREREGGGEKAVFFIIYIKRDSHESTVTAVIYKSINLKTVGPKCDLLGSPIMRECYSLVFIRTDRWTDEHTSLYPRPGTR